MLVNLWGPEGAGKTYLCLFSVLQRVFKPEVKPYRVFWFDVEEALDEYLPLEVLSGEKGLGMRLYAKKPEWVDSEYKWPDSFYVSRPRVKFGPDCAVEKNRGLWDYDSTYEKIKSDIMDALKIDPALIIFDSTSFLRPVAYDRWRIRYRMKNSIEPDRPDQNSWGVIKRKQAELCNLILENCKNSGITLICTSHESEVYKNNVKTDEYINIDTFLNHSMAWKFFCYHKGERYYLQVGRGIGVETETEISVPARKPWDAIRPVMRERFVPSWKMRLPASNIKRDVKTARVSKPKEEREKRAEIARESTRTTVKPLVQPVPDDENTEETKIPPSQRRGKRTKYTGKR